ncbi:MAG: hypothetical protein PVH73_00865 [Candidatus Bathyarchaeota archaeon]
MTRHKYMEFREKVKKALQGEKNGLTWNQLRKKGDIKYARPCYTWIGELENEIGLIRERSGRYVYWKLKER